MMVQPNSLFISRTFLPSEHRGVREHMRAFNLSMQDVTLQWRHLGEAGVMLVQSGEYQSLTQVPRSKLARQRPAQVAKTLNEGVLQDSERISVPLSAAAFLGNKTGQYVHIGFSIDPAELTEERDVITAALDTLNRAPGDWRHEFSPYISIATLNRNEADERVLQAFASIMPEAVTLYGARAAVG